ncbi:hypothetical protein SYJ56_19790 [Algoriphagus sp. D3-2-R+10]|uniref:hypothetical protein n=1 Tax=Algoriphagus aurantiacus TaxID=3103948 RepID=UPI002B3D1498|nr:hypothetical protein [Algoriphagus sp. D3-2-R+10]MEB2777568.1 hypothetical protein [Algoriphagus sp. D3-2-R+10]
MKYGLIAIFVLAVLSCTNDNLDMVNSPDLRGEWIALNTKTDTLSFETLNGQKFMVLKRAERTFTGLYEYKLLPIDQISIKWTLASTYNTYNDYYFKLLGDKLKIGNFYDSPSGTILTFQKLK